MDLSKFAATDGLLNFMGILLKQRKSMIAVVQYIEMGLYDAAHEAWEEIPHEDQIVLNRAESKGSFFRTFERQIAVRGVDKTSGWSYGLGGVSGEAEQELELNHDIKRKEGNV